MLDHRDFGLCDSLSTNELDGYFVGYRDRDGKALNGKYSQIQPHHIDFP